MNRFEMYLDMVERQDILNTKTIGPYWRSYDVSWDLTILTECAELLDSLNNYWWKKTDAKLTNYEDYDSYLKSRTDSIDIINAHIELVDIWHFLLSKLMNSVESLELVRDLVSLDASFIPPAVTEGVGELRANVQKSILRFYPMTLENKYISILEFFTAVYASGMTMDLLYKLYVGKSVLNTFRQDNGYKEGTYSKMWVGSTGVLVEDNKIMYEIAASMPTHELNTLYKRLETIYKEQE